MKVVFDAYWWAAGPPSLKHVLREIVFAWSRNFADDELVLVARHELTDAPAGARVITSSLRPQALLATVAVAAAAREVGADLVVSHNFAPRLRSGVSTIYLHDVLFETHPEWFTLVERAYFSFMTRWAPRADIVFTSSDEEAQHIRQHTAARAVRAVGLGLSTELLLASDDPDPRFEDRPFVLTVGRLNVRKNLGRVIESALATGIINRDRPLVVVGSANGRAADLDPALQWAISEGAIVFTGFASEERLRWYYEHTSLFVYLSLGEGFGMPPVEAAYFGAPVLVSDLPVFHETLGDDAAFVDPTDTDAITRALRLGVAMSESRMPVERQPRLDLARTHDWNVTVTAMRQAVHHRHRVSV